MERFYGFDLGDAESAVSRLNRDALQVPEVLTIQDKKSIISAYALLPNGELRIGENACYEGQVRKRKIRFKSRFLSDPASDQDVKSFSAGVLGELYGNGDLIQNEDCCFYVGCPAGWTRNDRERYRSIFEQVGYPPVKIVSESRAALVSACQSRHLQVGYDILGKSVLVVDIGSSTTDFAYVCKGREVDIQTAGEVRLGGGVMDEILLEECVKRSSNEKEIRRIFAVSEAWKNYCEFAARRLKEKYFSEEDYWSENPCTDSVMILYEEPIRLRLVINPEIASELIHQKNARIGNRSFQEVFEQSLLDVKEKIQGEMPELLFLTGGVSKLPAIRKWCEAAFPDAVVICGMEPEFSVSRGLAWCGRIDQEVTDFRHELEDLKHSYTVERIVSAHISSLYRAAVDTLVEPIIRYAAIPVFERWRKGEIRTLSEADQKMEEAIREWLKSEESRELLVKPIGQWLKKISDELEEYTIPICIRHKIPYSQMSLKSYLADTDIDIQIEARKIFGVTEITWLMDSIISVLIALLCGGSGVALISSGLPGILIGFAASFMVLALGKKPMEEAILNMDIPKVFRKMVPKNMVEARMESIIGKVKSNLFDSLEFEKNESISERMVNDISLQIESCLTKMAEVVEIPLDM